MEKELVSRLEAAVVRLEALAASGSAGSFSASLGSRNLAAGETAASDPAILAFDELVEGSVGRGAAAAEKIGGQVLEATKIPQEAFAVLRELLIKAMQRQVFICDCRETSLEKFLNVCRICRNQIRETCDCRWAVENQVGNKSLIIDDCDLKQSVYIYGCQDSVLQVKGKVNNITIDKCTKMGVVFTDVVAACEIVNCNRVEVQCQGSAPSLSIDNTSGCQLYLSKDSLGASVTTAKSSEVNILVPCASSDSDWAEHAIAQQYLHTFADGQLTTSPVSHSGG